MKRRYIVTYSRWDGQAGAWHETEMHRRTLEGARRLADRRAHKHRRGMSWTLAGGGTRGYVTIRDAKTREQIYDHPGFRVPSVGELGWTP